MLSTIALVITANVNSFEGESVVAAKKEVRRKASGKEKKKLRITEMLATVEA